VEEEATFLGSEIGNGKKSREGSSGLAAAGKLARETRLILWGRRDRYYTQGAGRVF